jgi:hypothetical protein
MKNHIFKMSFRIKRITVIKKFNKKRRLKKGGQGRSCIINSVHVPNFPELGNHILQIVKLHRRPDIQKLQIVKDEAKCRKSRLWRTERQSTNCQTKPSRKQTNKPKMVKTWNQ